MLAGSACDDERNKMCSSPCSVDPSHASLNAFGEAEPFKARSTKRGNILHVIQVIFIGGRQEYVTGTFQSAATAAPLQS